MSMNPDSQNFDQLRRLLALKRYEQPPPGYFNDFSIQVLARIQGGEQLPEAAAAPLLWEVPWLRRLWSAFETKPILAGAFGVAVCGLLITGVVYSEKVDLPATANQTYVDPLQPPDPTARASLLTKQASASSIEPTFISQTGSPLFDEMRPSQARLISLPLTPGN